MRGRPKAAEGNAQSGGVTHCFSRWTTVPWLKLKASARSMRQRTVTASCYAANMSTSWASIAKAPTPAPAAPPPAADEQRDASVLVVDANAIINGIRLEGIADKAVTIQEVLDEVRDRQSRQYLASLPFGLQVVEPSEESLKSVTRFARETGDANVLSTVDLRVLALAHTLEVQAHGSAHLKEHPTQPLMKSQHRTVAEQLPGWGNVPNPEDWKVIDAIEGDGAQGSSSRIAAQVQSLSLDDTSTSAKPSSTNGPAAGVVNGSVPQPGTARVNGAAAQASGSRQQAQQAGQHLQAEAQQQQPQQQPQQSQRKPQRRKKSKQQVQLEHREKEVAEGWEVAASSASAARHRRQKEARKAARQAWLEQEQAAAAAGEQQQQEEEQQETEEKAAPVFSSSSGTMAAAATDAPQAHAATSSSGQQPPSATAAAGAGHSTQEGEQQPAVASSSSETSDGSDSSDDDVSEESEGDDAVGTSEYEEEQEAGSTGAGGRPFKPRSSVACLTADFAMQNVLLQMGLRLLTPDGRRITRLSRWALRCSACFGVTREVGRLFCPKCGNMTMDRVELTIGADGAEYYGVKKRHVLRGTRYSLPKPKGGRNPNEPILREDVFLLKTKAFGKRAQRRPKKDAAVEASDDLFLMGAGEGGPAAWHRSQQELAQHRGLAAVLQPAWKRNPNERKGATRTNRRG